jgi:hypothetical protein
MKRYRIRFDDEESDGWNMDCPADSELDAINELLACHSPKVIHIVAIWIVPDGKPYRNG